MATSINETSDSICPWSFNQSNVVTCQDFVYLPHEHFLLNEVRRYGKKVRTALAQQGPYFQFNLTCESNEWKLSIVGSLANLAECIALPFIGLIADKYFDKMTNYSFDFIEALS